MTAPAPLPYVARADGWIDGRRVQAGDLVHLTPAAAYENVAPAALEPAPADPAPAEPSSAEPSPAEPAPAPTRTRRRRAAEGAE